MHSVWVFFLGPVLADDLCVGDLSEMVRQDILVGDDMKCVGSLNPFFGGVQWVMARTLAELAKLIRVGGVPDILILGVMAELAVLKGVACVMVEDQGRKIWEGLFTR